MQRRGRARISRPESGGDCYFSAKWGQLAVHHYRVELSGDSPTGGRAMSALNSKADKRANISLSLLCAKSGHTQSGELHPVASVAAGCRFSSVHQEKYKASRGRDEQRPNNENV
jgi:hypothetical protein